MNNFKFQIHCLKQKIKLQKQIYSFYKLAENLIHTFKFYYTEVEDLNKDNYNQNLKSSYNIKDKHLSHLQSRINTKQVTTHSEQKLLTLQHKLKNKPTKLAIVMQAIFDPPKSQSI